MCSTKKTNDLKLIRDSLVEQLPSSRDIHPLILKNPMNMSLKETKDILNDESIRERTRNLIEHYGKHRSSLRDFSTHKKHTRKYSRPSLTIGAFLN